MSENARVVWGKVDRDGKVTWTPVGTAIETPVGLELQLTAFPMSGVLRVAKDGVAGGPTHIEEASDVEGEPPWRGLTPAGG